MAVAGVACAGLFTAEQRPALHLQTAPVSAEHAPAAPTANLALLTAMRGTATGESLAPVSIASGSAAAHSAAPGPRAGGAGLSSAPSVELLLDPSDDELPLPPTALELGLAARSSAPDRTWQDAANTADWAGVAQLIDALPEAARSQPGTRYARAVAARELGQYTVALRALSGLESALPLFHEEIKAARAQCQMQVGPFEEAYQYFTREQSPENLILAAQTCLNASDLGRARETVERAFQKIRKQGDKRGKKNEIAARVLRARIAEASGERRLAARDWLWLATEVPTDPAAESADAAYERLGGQKLSTAQRMERLQSFSREGELDRTLDELALLEGAPGTPPDALEVKSALAWAYYHSRKDYLKAAELFRAAAALSAETRVKNLYFEARALSRANQDDQAIARFQSIVQRYPSHGYTEQAHQRIARLEYGLGRWEKAERAYSEYLDRYAKNGGGQYAGSSRYELAISRLGAKQRTEEAAVTLGQLARKERSPERRAMLSHLEAVALETTEKPKLVEDAIARYRSIIEDQPLSFAALASAARLRGLGRPEAHRARLGAPALREFPIHGRFAELPEKARFLAAIGLHTDAERALFDERAEVRRRYSDREGQALCEMYGSLDRGYRSYSLAFSLLKSEELRKPPSADNLWAWRCAYPQPYRNIVEAVENRYQLPESLVHAVMRQESGFRPNVVSPVGAVGLMQLMPNTARKAAEEITEQPGAPWVPDPTRPTNVLNNVELGGFYLGKLLSMLGGQVPVAVAAYNAGPGAVSRWLEGGKDLPVDVWVARIPYTETREYVGHVVGNWLAYRYLANPDEVPELDLAMLPGTQAAADAY
jgi:soluble lytic murein transglycosylase